MKVTGTMGVTETGMATGTEITGDIARARGITKTEIAEAAIVGALALPVATEGMTGVMAGRIGNGNGIGVTAGGRKIAGIGA